MDESLKPRMFLISGIANFVICIICLIASVILLSLKDTGYGSSLFTIFSISFLNLALLAIWQYRSLRTVNAKFQDLYARLPAQQQAAK